MGSRALHEMSGSTIIVSRRSVRLSSVRVASTAGTAQENPDSIGTNDFPCRPMRPISRSMTNATRARYPRSSSTPMNRNSIAICGMNTTTFPTPAMTPSTRRSRSGPAGIRPVTAS